VTSEDELAQRQKVRTGVQRILRSYYRGSGGGRPRVPAQTPRMLGGLKRVASKRSAS